jgi:hypothetical protein
MTSDQWIVFVIAIIGAAIQLYIPLLIGFPVELPSWAIGLSTLIGGTIAVVAFLALGPHIQPWIERQLAKTEKRERAVARVQRLGDRFGAFGVGFLAPFLIGLLLAAGIGIVLHMPRKRLGFYLTLVVLVWAIGLAVVATAMYGGTIPPPATG